MIPLTRRDLNESFQQYASRNQVACSCCNPPAISTLRQPWSHFDGCPQGRLYLNWRLYIEVVFPGRVCPLPEGFSGL
jgi:hypothetical protein